MKLVSLFDPTNEKHVMWLSEVDDAMMKASSCEKTDFVKVINKNPIKAKLENVMDWPHIHFQICMKYTQCVLRGTAFIPKIETPSK